MNVDMETASLVVADARARGNEYLALLDDLEIKTQTEYESVIGVVLPEVTTQRKKLDSARMKIKRPLLDAQRELDALFKPALDTLKKAESLLRKAGTAFQTEQELERQRLLREAQEAAKEGDREGFAKGLHDADDAIPEAAGTHTRPVWKFELEDVTKVPVEFLTLDEKKVRAFVNANKEKTEIPGVKVWKEESIVVRGTK